MPNSAITRPSTPRTARSRTSGPRGPAPLPPPAPRPTLGRGRQGETHARYRPRRTPPAAGRRRRVRAQCGLGRCMAAVGGIRCWRATSSPASETAPVCGARIRSTASSPAPQATHSGIATTRWHRWTAAPGRCAGHEHDRGARAPFWSHFDTVDGLAGDARSTQARPHCRPRQVVFRFHDHWHAMQPDGIAHAWRVRWAGRPMPSPQRCGVTAPRRRRLAELTRRWNGGWRTLDALMG